MCLVIRAERKTGADNDPVLQELLEINTFLTSEVDVERLKSIESKSTIAVKFTHVGRPSWPRIFNAMKVCEI